MNLKNGTKASKPIFALLGLRIIIVVVIGAIFFSGLPNRITYPKLYWQEARQYAEAFGVDPYLVMALIKVESNFRPGAKSKSGALGLMQIMPDTGRWAAGMLNTDNYYDARLLVPEFNIMIGSWYITHLLAAYNEPAIALAAYNAGRGNVDRWLADGTWSGAADSASDVPFRETEDFIKRVMKAWEAYERTYGAL